MKLRYCYRLYPTPGQKTALAKAFGCARVVFNDALALSQGLHASGFDYPGGPALQRYCITRAKLTPERAWLSEVSNVPLSQSVRDPDKAFRSWWVCCLKGKRKGKVRAPGSKKRSTRQSIRFTRNAFRVESRTPGLTRVGFIPPHLEPRPAVRARQRDHQQGLAGPYFASFVVKIERPQLEPSGKAVGVDPGLASLSVTSDGVKIAPSKFLRSALQRIKRLSRGDLSRKRRDSNNRAKARLRLAKAHARVADSRLDFLHKLTTRLIRENQTIVAEDLNVSGMLKNHGLAKSIADAGWRMFRTLLEAKTRIYGREVKFALRWEPTFQTCSACGHKDGKKPLSVRTWRCSACGAEHDRDINAAKNILAAGLTERLNACGAETKTGSPASGLEAETRLNQEVQSVLLERRNTRPLRAERKSNHVPQP